MQRAVTGRGAGWVILLALLVLTSPGMVRAQGQSPVALVEAVENAPDAGVEFLDYVRAGQQIDLGKKGRLTLTFLDGCAVEKITGGVVTVARPKSTVRGGRLEHIAKPCATAQLQVTAENREAGAAVARINSTFGEDWSEQVVIAMRPLFKWPGQGPAEISIVSLDEDPPAVLWQGQARRSHLQYPEKAPPLEVGYPYEIRVRAGDGAVYRAVFSIDPELEDDGTILSHVVTLVQAGQ